MQIRITGEHSIYAVRQALYECLALAESEYGVRYSIDATLYIRPSNGFGDEITPRFPNGDPVKRLHSDGPYQTAADDHNT
jgi:hypothetical protein